MEQRKALIIFLSIIITLVALTAVYLARDVVLDTYLNTLEVHNISAASPTSTLINGKFVVVTGTVTKFEQQPDIKYWLIQDSGAAYISTRTGEGSFRIEDPTGSLIILIDPGLNCIPRAGQRIKIAGYYLEAQTFGTFPVTQFYGKRIIGGCG
jgi:hypothetical protein